MNSQPLSLKQCLRIAICFAAVIMIVLSVQQLKASAQSTKSDIKVSLDTEELTFEVPPMIKKGTTLVPFRALFEALDMEVRWDQANNRVTGSNSSLTISLTIGEKTAIVNGKAITLLEPAQVVQGRTLVPLRFISESTGALVFWDPYNYEVTVITQAYLAANQLTKEQVENAVKEYLEERAKEEEKKKKEEAKKKKDEQNAKPQEPSKPVDLNKLDGMYYGFRMDMDGYECGGICWDMYTFLAGNKVFLGVPENGGPETIDCKTDECYSYTISKGKLNLSNGDSYDIEKNSKGFLVINGVQLDSVLPVKKGIKIDNDFVYMGFRGLVGISPASQSWTYYLTLNADGTFEQSGFSLASLGVDPKTNVATTDEEESGTYTIENNTITLRSDTGNVYKGLFFIHNTSLKDNPDDIQIGSRNYYVSYD